MYINIKISVSRVMPYLHTYMYTMIVPAVHIGIKSLRDALQSKISYFGAIMSERYHIIQSAWINIHEYARTRLVETHKQRVVDVHKRYRREELPCVCVSRENESNVTPLYCF